jgi:hypothetical protein
MFDIKTEDFYDLSQKKQDLDNFFSDIYADIKNKNPDAVIPDYNYDLKSV